VFDEGYVKEKQLHFLFKTIDSTFSPQSTIPRNVRKVTFANAFITSVKA
jgi:hypothetical protein